MAEINVPDDILKPWRNQSRQLKKGLPLILAAVVLVAAVATSFYSIGPDEVGVLLRFGKYIRTTDPGLHFKIPFIERAIPIKVKRIFKEEFGFRSGGGELRQGGLRRERVRRGQTAYQDESLMLTGDLNVLDVQWIVQFQIKDPVQFLFKVRDQRETIRDMSEAVMRRVVGDYSVDEVLTTKRVEINTEAQENLQEILNSYEAGIQIVTVKLQDVTPPGRVQIAFNEVNQAKQEKERMINEAWEAYNKVIPRAKGIAEKMIRDAEGYSVDVVNRAKGEANRFLARWEAYKKAPAVTKKRIYIQTLADVLAKPKHKYIIDPSQKSIIPFLQLNSAGGD